jgi:tetratricopeptide (TPR) repeat protein
MRRRLLPFAAVYVLALLVQIAYVVSIRDRPTFRAPVVDGAVYLSEAEAFRRDGSLPPAPFRYGPLYPILLGVWNTLARGDVLATHLIQVPWTSLTALLTALLAARLFGKTAGLVAGIAAALYWPLVYFAGEFLSEPVVIPLFLAFLLLVTEEGTARRALLAGAALGLASLARPNTLLVLVAIVPLEIARRRARRALLLALGCILPILPAAAHNAFVGKDPVLVSTSAGINFFIGNNERATGRDSAFPGMVQWTFEKAHRVAEIAEGRPLRPSEASSFYLRRGLAFIRENPGAFLALTGRKVVYLFSSHEIANVEDPNFARRSSRFLSLPLYLSFGVIAPLAAAGLAARRPGPREIPVLLAGAAYAISVLLFFVNGRYRLPLAPVFLAYGAAGLVRLAGVARGGNRGILRPLVPVGAALLLVNWNPFGKGEDASQSHFNEGWAAQKNGDSAAAEREYGRVERSSPWFAPSLNNRAAILMGRDDPAAALPLLVRATEIDSTYYEAWYNLGRAFYALGRISGAVAAFERAVGLWPDDAAYQTNLGIARKKAGDLEGAARAFRAALERDDASRLTRVHLAEVCLALGRPGEALPHLDRAVREEPNDPAAWHLYGAALAAAGRDEEARRAWREVLRIAPDSPLGARARASLER